MFILFLTICYIYISNIIPTSSDHLSLEKLSDPLDSAPDFSGSRLDLNSADYDDLILLPGIGEKTAEAILDLRDQLGYFRYPEDLLLVHGIGNSKLEALYDYVCTEKQAGRTF